MKQLIVSKEKHIETGMLIKIILATAYDRCYKDFAKYVTPGSIHEIVDRPSRMNRKNGDMGVWVQGTDGQKVFVRMFGWIPYLPEKNKKQEPIMQRTKQPEFRRTR